MLEHCGEGNSAYKYIKTGEAEVDITNKNVTATKQEEQNTECIQPQM
jgi:hypothetical protein